MARLYKTSSASPLDYMYQINAPLMERVIQANDGFITQNLQQAAQLESVASSFSYLQADEGRAKEITNQYSKQIDEISKAIRENPADWRKHVSPIRDVARDLQTNYKVGEISKITGNYNTYKNVSDQIDKQVEEYGKTGKGISADRARAYKQYFLNEFTKRNEKGTSYDPKTGEYNIMSAYNPMANIDIRKTLGEELDKLKADKKAYKKDAVTGQEWYFNTKKQEWEGVTPEKILGIVTDRLNNPQLMDYMRQDSQVGLINGVFDKDGKFVAPYNYRGVEISPQEKDSIDKIKEQIAKTKNPQLKQQLQGQLGQYENQLKNRTVLDWNENSYLSPIIRGLVSQYSYGQTSEEDLLRNNSKGSTQYIQAQTNFRQSRSLAQQDALAKMREAGINDRFDKTMEWNKYKWENPQEKAGSTKGTGTGKGKDGKDLPPVESTVSRLNTNSFEDWTTTGMNGNSVKVLSNEGLSADIGRLRTEQKVFTEKVAGFDSQMKKLLGNRKVTDLSIGEAAAYNNLRVQKEAIEKEIPRINSDLNARRKWYEGSVEAALSNNLAAKKDKDGDVASDLTKEEIALYRKYNNDRDGKAMLDKIMKSAKANGFLFEGANSGAYSNKFTQWLASVGDNTPEHTALRKEVTDYFRVKEKVDSRRENFLASVRYTPIDTDAVQVGAEDSKAIAQMIFANPQGLKLFDNTGNKASTILDSKGLSWTPSGDNHNMSFIDNDLIKYMAKHNVTPVIEQVGPTTKIGSGNAVVKLIFKDPNGEIPATPYYIEVTPEMQKQIGQRLTTNKDEGVKAIAGKLLDEEETYLRNQLVNPSIKQTAGGTGFDPVTYTIFINHGNTKIPLQVTKFVSEDGSSKFNVSGTRDGIQVPLPNTESGIPGWFNGPDDIINYIKTQRQK